MNRQLRSVLLAASALLAVIIAITSFQLFEEVDAGGILIVQNPMSGTLTVHTSPGPKWQGYGKVTHYRIRDKAWFITPEDGESVPRDAHGHPAVDIRFNDGGKAMIHGSIDYEFPIDQDKILKIHRLYGSQDAIDTLMRSIVERSVYLAGPLMSSTESYASRRNELLGLIEDQIQNGIYRTTTKEVVVKDTATGEEKTVQRTTIVIDKEGRPQREQVSLLSELGIKTFNLSVRHVKYVKLIEDQIEAQQKSTAAAQQAVIEARTAEQRKLTATAEAAAVQAKLVGEANAKKAESIALAEAKLAVEVLQSQQVKTNAVIQAMQKLEVAELATKEAHQFKISEELKGEGEAARRKAVLAADGALEQKLKAWVDVQIAYANALGQYKGSLVPQVVMGGAEGRGADSMQQLLGLMGVRAAKDLALDMSMSLTNHLK